MVVCWAYGCDNRKKFTNKKDKKNNTKNRKNQTNDRITFHRFPRDPSLREEWIKAIGRENWLPNDKTHLCSEHFNPWDINRTYASGMVTLKEGAIPCIFSASTISKLLTQVQHENPPTGDEDNNYKHVSLPSQDFCEPQIETVKFGGPHFTEHRDWIKQEPTEKEDIETETIKLVEPHCAEPENVPRIKEEINSMENRDTNSETVWDPLQNIILLKAPDIENDILEETHCTELADIHRNLTRDEDTDSAILSCSSQDSLKQSRRGTIYVVDPLYNHKIKQLQFELTETKNMLSAERRKNNILLQKERRYKRWMDSINGILKEIKMSRARLNFYKRNYRNIQKQV